ncbi:MAG: ydjZ 1 [Firmicutes bacterium]|nr:ydjZ 1 [Bacillota bacterium]
MQPNPKILRKLSIGLIVIVAVILYFLKPVPLVQIAHLLATGDIKGILEYIRSFGPYAALISFVIIVFINILAVIPNILMFAATGILFGVVEGTIISWGAESVGGIISFLLMRYIFRDYANQLIAKSNLLKKIDDFSSNNGFKIFFLARCVPFVPSGIITVVAAVSSIAFRDFVLATFLGKIPSAWIEVTLGHDLAAIHEHATRLVVIVALLIISYLLVSWYKHKTDKVAD